MKPFGWIVLAALLGGCAAAPPPANQDARPLYERIGGAAGVDAFVDALIARVHADPAVAPLFANTDMPYFRARLVEQLCAATGGGCEYTGLPMDEAHSGMAITDPEFDHFATMAKAALADAGVPAREAGEVMAILAGTRADVVGK